MLSIENCHLLLAIIVTQHVTCVKHFRRYLMEQDELIRRREELGGAGEDEEPIDLSIIRDSAASIRESWEALSVSEKRLLVSYVVRRIVWYPDRLEIEWQYGETTTIPYSEVRRGVAHV